MSGPLVSVLTGTWQRHDLLLEAIANVREQTYRPLEHVIVSDGPDRELRALITEATAGQEWDRRRVPITFVELGRNWSTVLPSSFAAAPVLAAQLLARGAYQTFLSDDERMTPDHIAGLVDALEEAGADFGYSQVSMHFAGRPDHPWIIGTDPPQCGQITNVLYRSDLLKRGTYPLGAGMTSDWTLYAAWMAAGAKHVFVPRVTFTHRADH
jgi:GT2 family glycosyltransferase